MTFSHKHTSTYLLLLSLLAVLTASVLARKVDLKINIGGPPVDGFSGEEEILQLGEEAVKTRYHGTIKGHGNDLKVFNTQRFARYEDLVINIPVPNGIYSVTLMFAETWKGAFNAGKRVFDVYMGSKPSGVVKVAENFDPFRSGGPAGPVRRKYNKIATFDGLTIALRPIAQNPQIAGIVVSGFSYSESFIDELPTVAGDPSEIEDFTILNSIGPKQPIDPLMIYDPNLNPKFKEKKVFSAQPAKSKTPVTVGALVGRTAVHAQQTLFTSSGPSTGSTSTTIDFSAHKNSLINRPASRSLSSPGLSPFIGLRSAKVRVSVANDGSLNLAQSAQHNLDSPSSSLPASHKFQRHGRRLASIPVQTDDQSSLSGLDSPESTRPNQIPIAQSYPNYAASTHLSEPSYQESPPRAFPSYNTGLEAPENEQAQAFDDTKSARFAGINTESHPRLAQHETRSASRNPDPYSQSNRENEQPIQQAQSESFQAAPHPSSQTETGLQLSQANSEVAPAGNALLSANMRNPSAHVSTFGAQLKDKSSDSSIGEERERQNFQSSTEGSYRITPPVKVQGIPVQERIPFERAPFQTEDIDSRTEGTSSLHNREGASPGNTMIGNSNTGHFKSAVNVEPSESVRGIQNQKDREAGETIRGSQTDQLRSTMWSDSYHSGTAEDSNMADAPTHTPGLTSHQVKMATEMQNEARIYKGNVMSHPDVSTTQTWQNAKPVKNLDSYDEQDPRMPETRRGEGYPAKSSSSLGMSSSKNELDDARLSNFRSNNFQTEPMSMGDIVSPGVHNGIGRLDGLCIDNSTHCSCGMVEQRPDAQEECLFVIDENSSPMACTIRPCNAKVICACASGASGLCQRSLVRNILVRAPTQEGMNDPATVACRRETLEEGVMVLTPIL